MNQILLTNLNMIKNRIKKFKILLIISICLTLSFLVYFIYTYISYVQKNDLSSGLLNTFNIEQLYSANTNYTVISLNENESFFIIGSIEIPSIGINYPILSDISDELLKIAPCKFYGPFPNKIGNLCIAGHNFDDNRFFGNINRLNIGDKINIYDARGSLIVYYVYDKYEVTENDTSCTSQNTYGKKEITLVTCNNLNGNRLVIKARE